MPKVAVKSESLCPILTCLDNRQCSDYLYPLFCRLSRGEIWTHSAETGVEFAGTQLPQKDEDPMRLNPLPKRRPEPTRRPGLSGQAVLFLGLAILGTPYGALAQQGQEALPCSSPEARQLDFWIGEWEVRLPNGNIAGHNTIEKILNGCVLKESYTTPAGYAGQSFNIFDASRGVWHQTWVDVAGLLLRLEGHFEQGAMVLEGETTGPNGPPRQRIRWSQIDGDPDRVRQLWETSADNGISWTVAFDGLYVRRTG